MCPSYMATREEKHSTRGRAHLLFEMMHGGPSRTVGERCGRDALSLCLACKGCKHDCPVSSTWRPTRRSSSRITMPGGSGRARPIRMGLIQLWSRVASPRRSSPICPDADAGAERAVKWLGGLAQARRMPPLPRRLSGPGCPARRAQPRIARSLLFPDTFNNFFLPGDGDRGGAGAGSGGLPRGGSAARPLLRAAALRLGHAGARATRCSANCSTRSARP